MTAVNHSIRHRVDTADRLVAIAAGRAIANRGLAVAIFMQMGIIRERLAKHDAALENEKPVGINPLDRRALQALIGGDREPPVGMEPRRSLEDRLKDCALQYTYGEAVCRTLAESEFDLPQDVPSRVHWMIQNLRVQNELPPLKFEAGTSLAAQVLAQQPRLRSKADLEFFEEYAPEIVVDVHQALTGVHEDDAETYIDSVGGLDRYTIALTVTEGLARKIEKLHGSIGKWRAGSPIVKRMASDLAVVEGGWRGWRDLTLELEREHADEIVERLEAGANVRDIGESDARLKVLGLDPEAASA